ncbi:MAG TPA: alpha/beta fold hydrolase [Acidimicrobiia bacterium]|nr:alpha/beta fold hydrolase [Acidimicrobiia bacterium]
MRVDPATTRTLYHDDPEVQEVLDIWAARFLHGQIELGDLTATVGRIKGWSDWGPEWMKTAQGHEELGQAAWDEGRRISAVGSFLSAARCYHLSYFLSVDDEEAHARGLAKMLECHDRVLSHMEPPVEKVAIPFPKADLSGLLSIPAGEGPHPVVIFLPGLDSTKEQRHGGRGSLLRRGMAVLSLDGPGQGEISPKLPIRHDYEVAVSAAIDFLESHDRIDAGRVGLIGASLGGYYACRAAAFEPRVTAAVANCGPYRWIDCWDELPAVTRNAFRKYSWSSSPEEAREKAKALDLTGVAEKIRQPLVVVHGLLDPLIGVDHARRIADEAPNATLITVEEATHGVSNLSYKFAPWVDDWMAERLGGRVT